MKAVVYQASQPRSQEPADLVLRVGDSLRVGAKEFQAEFGSATSLELDLLTLASAIFALDVSARRGMREEIVRTLELVVPVVNFAAFEQQRTEIEEILHILSHDNWTVQFQRVAGEPEGLRDWPRRQGKALLFSGGLDSFAAAVDLLDELGPDRVLLASHTTGNPATASSQQRLHDYLNSHYDAQIRRIVMRTGGKRTDEVEFAAGGPEVTQRTRSFMFLTIAALAARQTGLNEIVMIAENGQMAIHLPLSRGRIGAFSTHTAHPSFVAKVATLFSSILGFELRIENPYLYKTKAEVVEKVALQHTEAIPLSVSCWRSARVATGHCGECVPCFIRRVALECHGVRADSWTRDIFAENVAALAPDDEGKRNLVELAAFAVAFRDLTNAELDIDYCELYNEYFDRDRAAAMYRRFAAEAQAVLSSYPGLHSLL